MPLAPGTRIGPYEVVGMLGKGGMGAARFEREARILASLNHPNIATNHGLEDLDGSGVIVMELVDGPSLSDLIARGPIGVAEGARIAGQIADGIVHR